MMMRCFIALEVPEDLQDALGRVQAKLRAAGADVKWTAPRSIHLTVKFLGDMPGDDVPAVCDAMNAVAAQALPFELGISGLGTFPQDAPPRVLWAGIHGDIEPLNALVAGLEKEIADAVGIAPEVRPYHPHVTVGRVRSSRGGDRLDRLMKDEMSKEDLGTFSADELVLFMSELTREGPMHTPMARARFGGEALTTDT